MRWPPRRRWSIRRFRRGRARAKPWRSLPRSASTPTPTSSSRASKVREGNAAKCDFHPMSAADLPLMRRWLEMPHMREWWGEPETELGYIRDMIDGRDTTRPFLFSVEGEPAGYIQYWFIGDHQNATWLADHPWLAELPPDAVGVGFAIGASG